MKRASAPGYDLFKTIVAVILVVILILILLRGCGTNLGSPAPTGTIAAPNATETVTASAPATDAIPVTAATQTGAPSPVPLTLERTTTPTTVAPSPTPTAAVTEPPTTIPEQATPTQAQSASCNTSAPSRLNVGQTARVVRRLNVRDEASINATLLQTNLTETRVEIIAGPVCEPVGNGAYRWWQIRLANGAEGWSAELPLNATSYFLEPLP